MNRLLASDSDGRSLLALRGQRRPGSSRTMRVHLRTSLVLIALLLLGLPAAAHASGNDVIRDCADDGQLSKNYSQKDLQDAYNNLPSDIDEYTDCRQVISSAMGGGSGSKGTPPPNAIVTPSGAIADSPADIAALKALTAQAAKGKRPAVMIGGQKILPGNAGLSGVLGGLAGSNAMPSSLLAALIALVILAVVTAYLAAREKFPAVRRVALRVLGR